MSEYVFKFKGKTYEITPNGANLRAKEKEILLSDFQYCFEVGDYNTIKNRITNGLIYGWIQEIKN
jgi:hypothetical protein